MKDVSKKKRALITGASRGIGHAIMALLLEQGYEVVAPGHQELDLSSVRSMEEYIGTIKSDFDVLVNNAGINPIAKLCALDASVLAEVISVNLVAPIMLMKYCSVGMVERGYGRIVNISSIWGSVSKEGRGAYSAAKAGLEGVTRTAAIELGAYNVLVNAVAPGFVLTDLTRKNNSPEEIERIASSLPLKRLADPIEVAKFVEFLCSESNSFITGQTIRIDGGFSCL
jgi:3-oxoacyl-[acyl-carrier protein] reductase